LVFLTFVSVGNLSVVSSAVYMDPTGLVMPACKRGVCRRIPESSVLRDRGRPPDILLDVPRTVGLMVYQPHLKSVTQFTSRHAPRIIPSSA
jgi:hypothetical protein